MNPPAAEKPLGRLRYQRDLRADHELHLQLRTTTGSLRLILGHSAWVLKYMAV